MADCVSVAEAGQQAALDLQALLDAVRSRIEQLAEDTPYTLAGAYTIHPAL